MANVEFTDYRPRGLVYLEPSTALVEGDPALSFPSLFNETGLASGWYKITFQIEWEQPAGKYVEMVFTENAHVSRTHRLESQFNTPLVNDFYIEEFVEVTDGTLDVSFTFEFPDQSGATNATIDEYHVTYEKWVD